MDKAFPSSSSPHKMTTRLRTKQLQEFVMADITNWIDARIPATQTKSMGAAVK